MLRLMPSAEEWLNSLRTILPWPERACRPSSVHCIGAVDGPNHPYETRKASRKFAGQPCDGSASDAAPLSTLVMHAACGQPMRGELAQLDEAAAVALASRMSSTRVRR